MCGIVGYIGLRSAKEVLLGSLKRLEYRGYDSAGLAVFHGSNLVSIKSQGNLSALQAQVAQHTLSGHCGIAHTRWATHGPPSDVNAHPHTVRRVTLVHNGIVENHLAIKDQAQRMGGKFISQTDTETLAYLIDEAYHLDPVSAIFKALSQVQGSYALAIVFSDLPGQIFAIRKDSPLLLGFGQDEFFVSSDLPAILPYTHKYSILPENHLAILTRQGIRVINHQRLEVEPKIETADWDAQSAEKQGYPHFMLKEIFAQPQAISDTLHDKEFAALSRPLTRLLNKAHRLKIVACGTAMHAGLVGKNIFESLANLPVTVEIASEFRYQTPLFQKGDVCLFISQSGETADTIAALRLAKSHGVPTIALVNVKGSTLTRLADIVLHTKAGPEIAVASTKAYSVQLIALYRLALAAAEEKGKLEKQKAHVLHQDLSMLSEKVAEILRYGPPICQGLASQIHDQNSLFFIGRGADYAVAQEGSLKLKEISYINSQAYAAGELKHGTLSLITQGTPVIALATQPALFEKMAANIQEVKARGGKVILFCGQDFPSPHQIADHVLMLPKLADEWMPSLCAVPLQLLAYHCAVMMGCDVDRPRNLAKSVTVE